MTANKIKKKDIIEIIEKIQGTNNVIEKKEEINSFFDAIDSELFCSLLEADGSMEEALNLRNVLCLENVLKELKENNITEAIWQLEDIFSYRDEDNYITKNELSLLYIGLNEIKECISCKY